MKTTVKTGQLKTQKSGPLPSADEEKAPRRERKVEDSESPSDEDERKQKPLGSSFFDNSSVSDPSQSPSWGPSVAEKLDDKELPHEEEASSRAEEVASTPTPKKEALYTSTALKPFSLEDLSWAQLSRLERSRSHGRLVSTQLASLVSHFPTPLHVAVFDSTRVYLKSTVGEEEAHAQLTLSDTSKCSFMSSSASEERVVRVLKQSYQKDPSTAATDVLQAHKLTLSRPCDTHSGHMATYTAKGAELMSSAGYMVHDFTPEQVLQVRDYWKRSLLSQSHLLPQKVALA